MTLEEAKQNIKSTSSQHQQQVENQVSELRQDLEIMQDNVIVEISPL